MPRLTLGDTRGLLVLAAHPDDESLGAGGLIATARLAGLPVSVAVVTDGAASDGSLGPAGRRMLTRTRAFEARAAMSALGVEDLLLLAFPDGAVRENVDAIGRVVDDLVLANPGYRLVAPWSGDGHRDHRVLGEIAEAVARERTRELWSYPIWLWHWADPDDDTVPWSAFGALPLASPAREAKARALDAYPSQTRGDAPMLHAAFLRHFAGSDERFVVSAVDDGGS